MNPAKLGRKFIYNWGEVKVSNFSIIGCQHEHISIFIQEMLSLGHNCAGIYETDHVELAKALCSRYDVPFVSDKELLLSESISIVGSAAINNEKIEVIELCEKYGKHIMLDKPAVTNRNDFERLKSVVERGKIQIGLLLTERFRPSLTTLQKMISKGDLGEVINIAMRKPHRLRPENRPKWHFSKEQNGGIVIDLFIHDFDLLRWLTGKEIKTVDGYMVKTMLPEYSEFYDIASLQVVMEGNILAQLYADWHTPDKSWTWGDCRIFVSGTKGLAELRLSGDPLVSRDIDELLIKVTDQEELGVVELDSLSIMISEDFVSRINGKPAMIGHHDIIRATEATLAADEKVKIIRPTP
jgi:predicted dehydrogenase